MIKQLFLNLDVIERKRICIFQHFASSVSFFFFNFLFQYSNLFFLNYVVKNNNLVEYASSRIYIKNKHRRNIKLKDLIKFGSFGLLNAIDEYEPDIDIKFKNYALIVIMAYIYEEMWKIKTSPTKDIQNLINIILNENKKEER